MPTRKSRLGIARAWIAHTLLWQVERMLSDAKSHIDDAILWKAVDQVHEQLRPLIE